MHAKGNNLFMTRGDTEALRVKLQKEDGTPYFLEEGDIIYFTVKISPRTEEKLLQKVITEFVDGVTGEWVQPLGVHDAYQMGDQVLHGGKVWESTVNSNVWEPGAYGWEEYTE